MTTTTSRKATIALVLLIGLPATAAWARNRRCVQNCGPVVAECIADGGRPRACRRHVLRQCTHNPALCPTPVFPPPTTTTTLPVTSQLIDLRVSTAETLYEDGLLVPPAGSKFVRVGVTVTNRTGAPLSPGSPLIYTGGLGYPAYYQYPPNAGDDDCGSMTVIPSGGMRSCNALYVVPDESTTATLALQTYSIYPPGEARSDEFDIPSVPRPFAAVTVTDVVDVSASCTPRAGFRFYQLHVSLESHQGATEMTLGGQWSVFADEARYQIAYCLFPTDACDDRIGVPTNGSASCHLVFEVPVTVEAGRLDFGGYRYSASALFTIP